MWGPHYLPSNLDESTLVIEYEVNDIYAVSGLRVLGPFSTAIVLVANQGVIVCALAREDSLGLCWCCAPAWPLKGPSGCLRSGADLPVLELESPCFLVKLMGYFVLPPSLTEYLVGQCCWGDASVLCVVDQTLVLLTDLVAL